AHYGKKPHILREAVLHWRRSTAPPYWTHRADPQYGAVHFVSDGQWMNAPPVDIVTRYGPSGVSCIAAHMEDCPYKTGACISSDSLRKTAGRNQSPVSGTENHRNRG